MPAFVHVSREDHIVPWKTPYASNELRAGDTGAEVAARKRLGKGGYRKIEPAPGRYVEARAE